MDSTYAKYYAKNISSARHHCIDYIDSHKLGIFALTHSCTLDIELLYVEDGKGYNSMFHFECCDNEKKFDSFSTDYDGFTLADLQYFYDCKKIEINNISHSEDDEQYDFSQFTNLKHLNIKKLTYMDNQHLVEKIAAQIPPDCEFYIADGKVK